MDCSQILRKLSEIEDALGVLDLIAIKRMVVETQDLILQSQKESIQAARLAENRLALSRRSTHSLLGGEDVVYSALGVRRGHN